MQDKPATAYEQVMRDSARLKTVLDHLKAQIHVTQPESGKILFINRAMRQDYGLMGQDLSAATCWEILGENRGRICDCCPYEELKRHPERSTEWDSQDPHTGRFYHNVSFLVEWDDGERVYMCETTDVTETRQLLAAMERQMAWQQLQTRFTLESVQHVRLEAMVPDMLASTAELLGVERAFFLSAAGPEDPFALTGEWCAREIPSIAPALDRLRLDDLREEFSPRQSRSSAMFDAPDALPADLERAGRCGALQSLLVLPVRVEGALRGLLCYASHGHAHTWDDQSLAMLHTLCGILASAMRRIHAEQRREETQRALERAIVVAENASGAKSDFLSRMSHEIRTPMNVIIGMCRIALRSEDPAKIQHSLNQIDTSAQHLLGLINDILDVSKIEANKFDLHMEPFDLEHILMNVSNAVMVRAEERKQTIQILLARGMPRLFVGDSMRLAQVFTNLFTNAIKFSPEGGNIVLSMRETARDGNLCTLEARVRDHGIGMTQEQIARLFTSFEQADGGIARKYGGTGLGLAICKSIVNMMGGEICAESEPGKGSSFIFTVRMELAPPGEGEEPHEQTLPADLRVLVVDDEPSTCEYFIDIMAGFNVASDQAHSGQEALCLLERGQTYDMIFVDWRMPGMDGVETVRRLKKLLDTHVPVVMIASADLSDIREEATEAGVRHFVSKPLFPSDLYNVIHGILHAGNEPPRDKPEGSLSDVPDLRDRRILLAEDMEFNREVARSMLEETGCLLDEAESGARAVEMVRRDPLRYGCILMDMQMPEMDGLEATRAIRAMDNAWAQKVPIIAMTANVFRDDIEQCLAAGMDDHIGKPIVDHTLYEKLAFYLHASAPRAAAVLAEPPPDRQDAAQDFLPYVRVQEGLARLRNNHKLFATLLGSFQRNAKYAELREEIRQRRYGQAALSAHALKGIVANIELEEIRRLVVEAETALKADEPPPPPLLDALEEAYQRTTALLPRVIRFLAQENPS